MMREAGADGRPATFFDQVRNTGNEAWTRASAFLAAKRWEHTHSGSETPGEQRNRRALGGLATTSLGVTGLAGAAYAVHTGGVTAEGAQEAAYMAATALPTTQEVADAPLSSLGQASFTAPDMEPVSQVLDVPHADIDELELPGRPDLHPEGVGLDTFNAFTGNGTIWSQVEAYAGMLGYADLSATELHKLVSQTLEANNLTWAEARNLPVGFEVQLPTPDSVTATLDPLNAERTFVPTFPDVDVDVPNPDPPAAPPPPTIPEDAEWRINLPWTDFDPEVDDVVTVAAILAAAGLGGYAISERGKRKRLEKRLASYERNGAPVVAPPHRGDRIIQPATTTPPPAPVLPPRPRDNDELAAPPRTGSHAAPRPPHLRRQSGMHAVGERAQRWKNKGKALLARKRKQ